MSYTQIQVQMQQITNYQTLIHAMVTAYYIPERPGERAMPDNMV